MPCVDMVATGKRIKAMRVAKGMTVKDVQEIFGFGSANTKEAAGSIPAGVM